MLECPSVFSLHEIVKSSSLVIFLKPTGESIDQMGKKHLLRRMKVGVIAHRAISTAKGGDKIPRRFLWKCHQPGGPRMLSLVEIPGNTNAYGF